jgi:hypothetical protein
MTWKKAATKLAGTANTAIWIFYGKMKLINLLVVFCHPHPQRDGGGVFEDFLEINARKAGKCAGNADGYQT